MELVKVAEESGCAQEENNNSEADAVAIIQQQGHMLSLSASPSLRDCPSGPGSYIEESLRKAEAEVLSSSPRALTDLPAGLLSDGGNSPSMPVSELRDSAQSTPDHELRLEGVTSIVSLAATGGIRAQRRLKEIFEDIKLRSTADINERNPTNERTALHYAAVRGDTAMVQLLARQYGIDFNAIDSYGFTPLACAVQSGNCDTVRRLLLTALVNNQAKPLDPTLHPPGMPHQSPIALAIEAPRADLLHSVISVMTFSEAKKGQTAPGSLRGGSLTTRQSQDTRRAAISIQKMLLSPVDIAGRLPLFVVLRQAQKDKRKLAHVAVLLEEGAPIAVLEPSGKADTGGPTPLHLMIQIVADIRAEPIASPKETVPETDKPMEPGNSDKDSRELAEYALHLMLHHPQIADAAVIQDASGNTSLHTAIQAGLDDVAETLAQVAAQNPNRPVGGLLGIFNHAQHTPIALARMLGRTNCAELLLHHQQQATMFVRRSFANSLLRIRAQGAQFSFSAARSGSSRTMPDSIQLAGLTTVVPSPLGKSGSQREGTVLITEQQPASDEPEVKQQAVEPKARSCFSMLLRRKR